MDGNVTNIDELLHSFDELWSPHVLARVNDYAVKVAKVEGEYVWHSHVDTDEVFIVLDGELDIHMEIDGARHVANLKRNDTFVVPQGVQHRPVSTAGAQILMIEPADTLSTGDYAGSIPDHIISTTGD